MANSRVILHPIINNKRSRNIFFGFLGLTLILSAALWWELSQILIKARINPIPESSSISTVLTLLSSTPFRLGFIFMTALLATALTARLVIGPIKRIEQFLTDWLNGLHPSTLRVRANDKFEKLVSLINTLYKQHPDL